MKGGSKRQDMGFQDREYYREPSAPGTVVMQSVVVKLIVINVVLFLANMFFGGNNNQITDFLSLQGNAIAHPWMWYQFLTAGFAHSWVSPLHIAGNMLGLYFFGRALEQRFGPREFLRFYLTALVFSLLVWGVRNYFFVGPLAYQKLPDGTIHEIWRSCLGASGGVTACVILFCLLYPRATLLLYFAIPTPAWLAGLLLVALDLFGTKIPGMGNNVAYDAHLAGAAFALAYWYFGWNFGRLPGMAQIGGWFRSPKKWLQAKPPLKVHDPEQYYEDLDAEADRLLQKVNRDGLASLTPKERQLLEDYSRRTRQKLR
jgi:membrane associated rhomboid family serine protease